MVAHVSRDAGCGITPYQEYYKKFVSTFKPHERRIARRVNRQRLCQRHSSMHFNIVTVVIDTVSFGRLSIIDMIRSLRRKTQLTNATIRILKNLLYKFENVISIIAIFFS
jgi:hypothetical protein